MDPVPGALTATSNDRIDRIRKPDPQLIQFLSRYPPSVCELMMAARRLVLQEFPAVSETVNDVGYTVTNAFTFSGRFKEAFCYAVAGRSYINLGFPQGASLPDPDGKLVGTGKSHRHLRIASETDLEAAAVRRLLHMAADRADLESWPAPPKPTVVVRGPALKKKRPRAKL